MEKAVIIISILLVHVSLCLSASRVNSRSFQWDDEEDTSHPEGSHQVSSLQGRNDRKLVFINNKAYDLSEAEEARVWEQYVGQGNVPVTDKLSRQPEMDSLSSAMKINEQDEEVASEKKFSDAAESTRQNLEDIELVHKQGSVKASRFVADPQKAALIEKVDGDELQRLRDATTPVPDEKIATEAPTETSTVRYEYTQVSVLSFLWNEVRNLGELLGREMIGSLSGTLYYIWESVVRMLQANTRQAITDASNEL